MPLMKPLRSEARMVLSISLRRPQADEGRWRQDNSHQKTGYGLEEKKCQIARELITITLLK